MTVTDHLVFSKVVMTPCITFTIGVGLGACTYSVPYVATEASIACCCTNNVKKKQSGCSGNIKLQALPKKLHFLGGRFFLRLKITFGDWDYELVLLYRWF